jgi:hypothetical protein
LVCVIYDDTDYSSHMLRFVDANPVIFRIGDLVEVQLTAAAIPIKHSHYKMILSMRTIAIIDSNFAEVTYYTGN